MLLTNRLTIKVLCIDDHPFVADALQARLSSVTDMEFVGRLTSAEDVVSEVKRTNAEIVLMDIEMPGKDPFEAIDDLARQCPNTKVVMLSAFVRDHYIDSAVAAGAWGYLSKSDEPDVIIEAIRKVHRGEFVFGADVMARCNVRVAPGARPNLESFKSKLGNLTAREQQVLRMIGKGMTRTQIARELCRSPKTVDAHRSSIMEKMDIHDRVELARYAIREGLVEI
jgi:DNA-binding NarL/FixJ family response regulator